MVPPAVVAITGIRALAPESVPDVELEIIELLSEGPAEIRFGGALGTDTAALLSAALARGRRPPPRLVVYVPFDAGSQPYGARQAFRYADEVIELNLPRSKAAYLRRNDAMLDGASLVLAFTDGCKTGGTAYTVRKAKALKIQVRLVGVARVEPEASAEEQAIAVRAPMVADTYVLAPYVSAKTGPDPTSDAVRDLKAGKATEAQIEMLARAVAQAIEDTPALRSIDGIVAMPRRSPGRPSDLWPVVLRASRMVHLTPLPDWLVRVREPKMGESYLLGRRRFPAEEHASTMAAGGKATAWRNVVWSPSRVLVLDNVLTTGATLNGAYEAIRRDTGADPVGMAILFSAEGVKHAQRREPLVYA